MIKGFIKGSKSMACGGALQRKEVTFCAIALALFVILGSPLFAQAPALQQQPEFVAAKRATAISTIGTAMSAHGSSAASAQGEISEIRVAVVIAPPIVMEQNGSLTGFSIDLWNAIAKQLKVKTSYQIKPDYGAVEEALRSNNADLTVAATLTSARDEVFDFSLPTLETGLQIMVLDTGPTRGTTSPIAPVLDMLRLLFSRTTLEWIAVGLLIALIPAHVAWLLERGRQDGIISSRNYFPGIFEACFWGLSSLACQAQDMPRQWLARSMAIFWMFASVVFIASYTAQLTTTLTVEQIRGAIEGPSDLPGKQVATIMSSATADYLREQKAQVQEFPPDQMFRALLDRQVDAVVAPAPVLLYYAANEGKGRVKVVGPEFNRGQVAILVPVHSPLRREIDRALLVLRENGTYQRIYDKWFGVLSPP